MEPSMTKVHGKNVYISLDSVVVTGFSNSVDWTRSADSHDVTCFGATYHTYFGGLGDGKITLGGIYESGVGGVRDVVQDVVGTNVTLIYGPEGNATGKPKTTVTVLVTSYQETAPVADMITWKSECQPSGAPTDSTF